MNVLPRLGADGIATIASDSWWRNSIVRVDTRGSELDRCRKARSTEKFSGSFSHYDDCLIIVAWPSSSFRWCGSSARAPDRRSGNASGGKRQAELVLSVVLALIVATLTVHLALA